MTGFENYAASTKEIELQIERKGVVLGIDWNNEAQVRKLAREALSSIVRSMIAANPKRSSLAINL